MKPTRSSRFPGYLGLLVLLAGLTAVAGDRTVFFNPPGNTSASPEHAEGSHSDPESEKRMAIFHFNEGNKGLKAGDLAQAIHQYEMALHHDSDLNPVVLNLSTAYLRAGQYDKAGQTLQRLEKAAPALPELHYNLACYYALTGRAEEGLESIRKAVRLGYRPLADFQTDPDLISVRRLPAFQEWMETL